MYAMRWILTVGLVISAMTVADSQSARAQYPVVQTVQPAVVGYSATRRGLFGRRLVLRPVVAPVTSVAPVSVARPVVVQRPVVVARPVVQTYYRAPAPVAVPIRTYRVPVVYSYGF